VVVEPRGDEIVPLWQDKEVSRRRYTPLAETGACVLCATGSNATKTATGIYGVRSKRRGRVLPLLVRADHARDT
jgi:hypothetical protein